MHIDLDSPSPAAQPWSPRAFVTFLLVAAVGVAALFVFGPALPAAHADTTTPPLSRSPTAAEQVPSGRSSRSANTKPSRTTAMTRRGSTAGSG